MYYISNIEQDLIDYNDMVNQGENYNGTTTTWANVIKHYDLDLYAILKHPKYNTDLETINNLDGWYEQEGEN
jgi:hypothetical protein